MLWPQQVHSIEDVPDDLLRAIQHAFKVLGWYENLMSEEIPPEWMWPFDEELEAWFDQVERDRKDRYGSGSERESLDSSNGGIVLENELAADMRKTAGRR